MRMLDALHKKGVLYLRPVADNCFIITENGRLTVVSLNFGQFKEGGAPSISKFAKWDGTANEATDLLSLGVFIHKILHGSYDLFEGDSQKPEAKAPHKKLVKKLCDSKDERKDFDPHKKSFLTPELKVELKDSTFSVNEYSITWEDGIGVGYGDTEVGFALSDSKLYLKNGEATLGLGANGFTMEDEEERLGLEINAEGLTLKQGRSSMNLGPNGLHCDIGYWGYFDIDAAGLHYYKDGKHLEITESGIDFDFDKDDVKLKPGATTEIKCCKMKVKVGTKGFELECGKPKVEIGKDGFQLSVGGAKVVIDGKGFHMFCGAITLTIDSNGCTIGIGESSAVINGDGLTFAAEGFTFKVGKDGPSIENDNAPLDLAQYGCTIPSISLSLPGLPKIPSPPMPPVPKALPGMPSAPSLPKIGLSFGKKKEKKPDGKVEDFLKEGETVQLRATTIKKKLFGKRKLETVLTSTNRTFFLNSHCNDKVGDDLIVGKGAKIDKKKKKLLIVVDAKGKKWKLLFNDESDRDKFADAYKELA